MIFKSKLIKILLSFILILLFTFGTIKIFKIKESNNINIKYVNKIESNLYQKINVYDYNENTSQYEIKELMFTKDNIYEEIFYYYNDKFSYSVDSIEVEENNKIKNIIINLKDNSKDINLNDFKLLKLTYRQLNINNIIIKYKDNQIIV
jgi:hypothetical protein